MNILFVVGKYPDDGGVAKVTTVLANGLKSKGHNVSIGSFLKSDEYEGSKTDSGIQQLILSMPVGGKENITLLNRYIEANKIDIIVCQWAVDFRVSRFCRKAVKETNCKIVSVLHTSPGKTGAIQRVTDKISSETSSIGLLVDRYKLGVLKFISKLSLMLTYHYSDCFLSLSPKLKEEVQSFLGIRKAIKLGYIYNPITIDGDNEVGTKEKTILYVGRLDNITKRVDRILDVWKLLSKRTNGWNLILVGDGPDKDGLEEYVRKNNLQNVVFAGYADPKPYYRISRIILLTSGYEGFPLVLGEAMSYGVVPVVLGSFIAVTDIIDNGKSGVVVDMPFETKKYTDALHNLMENMKEMDVMSHEAILKSHSFRLSTVLNEWERLFYGLLLNKNKS